MVRHRYRDLGVMIAGLCTLGASANGQHDVGDFLTPGIVEQVDHQLEHTRDEHGNRLPGWFAQPWGPPIKIWVTEPPEVRLKQTNRSLDLIRVAPMSFNDEPVGEVVKALRAAINTDPRPERHVNVVLKMSPEFQGPRRLTLQIEETTARLALQQVADVMGAKLIVGPFGVSIVAE